MLQLINANARVSPGGSAEQTLPSGFAQAGNGDGAPQPFDQQMVVQGFVAGDAQALHSASATPETIHISEADAEQWLASMLGQQAVRIEAREAPEPAQQHQPVREEEPDRLEQSAVLPAERLDQAQTQPRERQPADVPRAAPAALPSQQPAAMPDPLAAPKPLMAAEVAMKTASPLVLEEGVEIKVLERLPGSGAESDKAAPGSASASSAAPAPLAPERHLKLHAPQAQWGEQMLASLREHVDLQINQRIQNATIRLDPPELGSLEIFLSHESGRLSVQLSAANAEVARLLQQTSERLRQELVGQNFVQVNVQVSADAQGGRQQQQAQAQAWLAEDAVAAAVALPSAGERSAAESASDVLVTV